MTSKYALGLLPYFATTVSHIWLKAATVAGLPLANAQYARITLPLVRAVSMAPV
jgi:hypothetical protein